MIIETSTKLILKLTIYNCFHNLLSYTSLTLSVSLSTSFFVTDPNNGIVTMPELIFAYFVKTIFKLLISKYMIFLTPKKMHLVFLKITTSESSHGLIKSKNDGLISFMHTNNITVNFVNNQLPQQFRIFEANQRVESTSCYKMQFIIRQCLEC